MTTLYYVMCTVCTKEQVFLHKCACCTHYTGSCIKCKTSYSRTNGLVDTSLEELPEKLCSKCGRVEVVELDVETGSAVSSCVVCNIGSILRAPARVWAAMG